MQITTPHETRDPAPTMATSSSDVNPPPDLDPGRAYRLSTLQAAASYLGISKSETCLAAQSLYERGLISYWKVDDTYLAENQFEECAAIVRSYVMASGDRSYDPKHKGSVWNSEKVGSHHGIIPTMVPAAALFGVTLTQAELNIFALIQRRLLDLFKPR